MQQEYTISAIATPLGEGGIGIIRISGSTAIEIAENFLILNIVFFSINL